MTNRTANVLSVVLTAMCLAACAPGIDVGQATGTGTGTASGTGGAIDGGLEVSPNPLDFGTIDAPSTQSVVLSNPNAFEVDGITATISGPEAGWFQVLDAPTTLGAGNDATVNITFAPSGPLVGAEASVTFTGAGGESVTLGLAGTSVESALQIAPNPIDFGYVALLTTAVACTTVTNVVNVDVTIESLNEFANEGDAYAIATTDDATPPNSFSLPITIPAGQSAKVCFALTPPITQQYVGQATLVTNDPSGINTIVQLTGWGGGPQIFCTPLSLNFGAADAGPATLPVLCDNNGTAIPTMDLILGSLTTSSSAFSAQYESDAGLLGLEPGQSVTIDVTYQPSGDGGDTGTLQIPSNGGQGQPVSILLSGSGS